MFYCLFYFCFEKLRSRVRALPPSSFPASLKLPKAAAFLVSGRCEIAASLECGAYSGIQAKSLQLASDHPEIHGHRAGDLHPAAVHRRHARPEVQPRLFGPAHGDGHASRSERCGRRHCCPTYRGLGPPQIGEGLFRRVDDDSREPDQFVGRSERSLSRISVSTKFSFTALTAASGSCRSIPVITPSWKLSMLRRGPIARTGST